MFGEVRLSNVYYQITYTGIGTLHCAYRKDGYSGDFSNLLGDATYYSRYAECSPWTKGNPDYTIRLTLDNKTYFTDENAAIAKGKHQSSGIM